MAVHIIAIVMTSLVFLVLARLNDEKHSPKLVVAGIIVGIIWIFLTFNFLEILIDKIG